MTRINIVEPKQLTNQHLMAEYRELPRVFSKVLKRQEKGQIPTDVKIPETYVLGRGHETFFFDKCQYLLYRYENIVAELMKREYNLSGDTIRSVRESVTEIDDIWYNNWTPTPDEIYLNMARLANRSKNELVKEELLNA